MFDIAPGQRAAHRAKFFARKRHLVQDATAMLKQAASGFGGGDPLSWTCFVALSDASHCEPGGCQCALDDHRERGDFGQPRPALHQRLG